MALGGYGLIATGAQYRDQALAGLAEAATQETERKIMNEQMASQQKMANMQTGAALGGLGAAALGFGPVGMIVGTIGGGLLGGLF